MEPKTLAEIQQRVEEVATRLGAPAEFLPTYERSDDCGRPDVQMVGTTYYY